MEDPISPTETTQDAMFGDTVTAWFSFPGRPKPWTFASWWIWLPPCTGGYRPWLKKWRRSSRTTCKAWVTGWWFIFIFHPLNWEDSIWVVYICDGGSIINQVTSQRSTWDSLATGIMRMSLRTWFIPSQRMWTKWKLSCGSWKLKVVVISAKMCWQATMSKYEQSDWLTRKKIKNIDTEHYQVLVPVNDSAPVVNQAHLLTGLEKAVQLEWSSTAGVLCLLSQTPHHGWRFQQDFQARNGRRPPKERGLWGRYPKQSATHSV